MSHYDNPYATVPELEALPITDEIDLSQLVELSPATPRNAQMLRRAIEFQRLREALAALSDAGPRTQAWQYTAELQRLTHALYNVFRLHASQHEAPQPVNVSERLIANLLRAVVERCMAWQIPMPISFSLPAQRAYVALLPKLRGAIRANTLDAALIGDLLAGVATVGQLVADPMIAPLIKAAQQLKTDLAPV